MAELIGFRALQGIGAGGLMVGAQAIIADIVPPRERGRYIGLIGAVFAVASVAGPLLGGFLVDNLSWRWVFYVNLPVGALAVVIVATRLHLHTPHVRHQIDYLGFTLLSSGVAALILLTTWGGSQYAWGSNMIIGLGIVGVLLLAVFVWWEARAPEPILPLQLFRSRIFSISNAMGFTIGMAMFGAIIFIPLYLQIVYGVSPTTSGLLTIPLMAGLLVASIASGRVITRVGRYKAFPIAGTAILIVGMFMLSRLGVHTATWVASAYMVVVGIGLGLVMQVLVLAVQNDARPQEIGVATASATFFRSMGGAFGVAIFGTIFATRLANSFSGLPHSVTAHLGSGVQLNPTQIDHLPPAVHDVVLHAFAHALSGMFLFGMVLSLVPFILSWFLREKPLRTTVMSAGEVSAIGAADLEDLGETGQFVFESPES
jgi:EmrB/QacA subfamily drug resistance transporter